MSAIRRGIISQPEETDWEECENDLSTEMYDIGGNLESLPHEN